MLFGLPLPFEQLTSDLNVPQYASSTSPLEVSGYEQKVWKAWKYPQDKQALHGPPDKTTNFAVCVEAYSEQQEIHCSWVCIFVEAKQQNISQSKPDLSN